MCGGGGERTSVGRQREGGAAAGAGSRRRGAGSGRGCGEATWDSVLEEAGRRSGQGHWGRSQGEGQRVRV